MDYFNFYISIFSIKAEYCKSDCIIYFFSHQYFGLVLSSMWSLLTFIHVFDISITLGSSILYVKMSFNEVMQPTSTSEIKVQILLWKNTTSNKWVILNTWLSFWRTCWGVICALQWMVATSVALSFPKQWFRSRLKY